MGDYSPETERELERKDDERYYARDRYFRRSYLCLDSISWISNHIDSFVSQSRGNQSVEEVRLCPHSFKGHDDGFWENVGQAVGNLQELKTIYISPELKNDDGADALIPDWGRLAQILSHVRQKVKVQLDFSLWAEGEVQALARALSHGHPAIT
jgi:hypothetical protein